MDKIFEISSDGKTLIHCSNNAEDFRYYYSGVIFYKTLDNAAQEFRIIN
jgi:hypothetical protein